jgi:hypothetical protein
VKRGWHYLDDILLLKTSVLPNHVRRGGVGIGFGVDLGVGADANSI